MIQMGTRLWEKLYNEYIVQLRPYRFTFFGERYQITEDDDGRLAFIHMMESPKSLENTYTQVSQ